MLFPPTKVSIYWIYSVGSRILISKKYREYCSRYSVKAKQTSRSGLWGKKLLAGLRGEMIRKKECGRNKSDNQSNLFGEKGARRRKEKNSTIFGMVVYGRSNVGDRYGVVSKRVNLVD